MCLWGGKWDGENIQVSIFFGERERNLGACVSGLPSIPNSSRWSRGLGSLAEKRWVSEYIISLCTGSVCIHASRLYKMRWMEWWRVRFEWLYIQEIQKLVELSCTSTLTGRKDSRNMLRSGMLSTGGRVLAMFRFLLEAIRYFASLLLFQLFRVSR